MGFLTGTLHRIAQDAEAHRDPDYDSEVEDSWQHDLLGKLFWLAHYSVRRSPQDSLQSDAVG